MCVYLPHITDPGFNIAWSPILVHMKRQDVTEVKEAQVLCSDPYNDIAVICVKDVTLQLVSTLPHLKSPLYIIK